MYRIAAGTDRGNLTFYKVLKETIDQSVPRQKLGYNGGISTFKVMSLIKNKRVEERGQKRTFHPGPTI